LVFSTKWTM